MIGAVVGLAAQVSFEGVGERFEPCGERPRHGVDLGEEFLVAPFGFLLPVDFAAFDLADVVPQFGDELFLLPVVETAESSRHDLRVAALLPHPCADARRLSALSL